ncbi:MAG: 30S ribosome-binding factor RbfA [Candidatus Omnitrophica bacterium]|nr:30S ribosome-binding factor RbfA [Candidatus Omnitrophota bacterium]
MQGKRTLRVAHLVQMELSRLILSKMRDPRLGFVTVTHVAMSPDLKSARIFYSVMGNEKNKKDSKIALEHARGFLQKQIAMGLKLRYTPKLVFEEDDSLDQGMKVDRVIHEIHRRERDPGS